METEKTNALMTKRAFSLGIISIFSYLASYYTRNLLSVATPSMLKTGEYTSEFIGLLSSVYFLVYAAGQFVNGFVGDLISPRYMITAGLSVAGVAVILFPIMPFAWLQVLCFVLMGVGLSMLRGPIMKLVSENLDKDRSRIVCTLLSVASFAGPLIASVLAIMFAWNMMFIIAGAATLAIAAVAFVALGILEHRGGFAFKSSKGSGPRGYLQLFKIKNFVFYMVVGGVVEIAGSAITFWIPTYLSEALRLDTVRTNSVYSVISVVSSLAPFLALFIFKLTKERDIAMMRGGFLLSVAFFACMMIFSSVWARIAFLIAAKLCLSCCSAVLWSIYIPGMGDTGKVSSINGVINCTGYLSASAANAVFANLIGLSWNGVVAVWCGIAGVGLIASLTVKMKKVNIQKT